MNSIHEFIFLMTSMGILLLVSAFFSGTETALFSLSSEGARSLRARKRTNRLLQILQEEPDELLTAILSGNLLVNILFFCTGAAASGQWAASRGGVFEAVGAILILMTVILFGEIVPKAVGVAHPRQVLLFAASPLHAWFRFTKPFRGVVGWALRLCRLKFSQPDKCPDLTPGELGELVDAVREEPGFGPQEKEVLEDILILPDVRAREIMIPRTQIARKSMNTNRETLLAEARATACAHILISGQKEDEILGYIPVSSLLLSTTSRLNESDLRPVSFVPEMRRLDLLLKDFFIHDWNIVGVVDEYGGFSGVVTLENILSHVVGGSHPIKKDDFIQLNPTTYRLSGLLPVRAWRELFVGVLSEKDAEGLAFDTLGGFVVSLLERIPCAGDKVSVRNLQFTVERVERGRVETVLLHLHEAGGDHE